MINSPSQSQGRKTGGNGGQRAGMQGDYRATLRQSTRPQLTQSVLAWQAGTRTRDKRSAMLDAMWQVGSYETTTKRRKASKTSGCNLCATGQNKTPETRGCQDDLCKLEANKKSKSRCWSGNEGGGAGTQATERRKASGGVRGIHSTRITTNQPRELHCSPRRPREGGSPGLDSDGM